MVSAGLCGKATPQLLGPFFIEESCKIDSSVYCRILEDNYAPAMSLIPAPVVWHNAPSHNSKATRDWKKANFQYPELCWPPQSPDLARWTTASGRPWSPRFQRSVFHRKLLSKQPLPVHLLWSRRPMFLTRRSVRSRIAFNSVSMPTEAISRHNFLQMLHSWCESTKIPLIPIIFSSGAPQQQIGRQTDSTHMRGPTQPRLSSDPGSYLIKFGLKCRVLR